MRSPVAIRLSQVCVAWQTAGVGVGGWRQGGERWGRGGSTLAEGWSLEWRGSRFNRRRGLEITWRVVLFECCIISGSYLLIVTVTVGRWWVLQPTARKTTCVLPLSSGERLRSSRG